MMELRNTPASSLDKFIEDNLLSNTEFRTQVNQAIDTICTFLKERCFRFAPRPIRVSKVVKGGSSGKGTTLRGRSDADLVVFLTNLKSFREQLQRRGQFIEEIRIQLEALRPCTQMLQGGSSREGTTLRGRSDADLVVFLTNLKSFREHFECRGEFIKEIRRQLEACPL